MSNKNIFDDIAQRQNGYRFMYTSDFHSLSVEVADGISYVHHPLFSQSFVQDTVYDD